MGEVESNVMWRIAEGWFEVFVNAQDGSIVGLNNFTNKLSVCHSASRALTALSGSVFSIALSPSRTRM